MDLLERYNNIERHIEQCEDLEKIFRLIEIKQSLRKELILDGVPDVYSEKEFHERLGAIWYLIRATKKANPTLSKSLRETYDRFLSKKQDLIGGVE